MQSHSKLADLEAKFTEIFSSEAEEKIKSKYSDLFAVPVTKSDYDEAKETIQFCIKSFRYYVDEEVQYSKFFAQINKLSELMKNPVADSQEFSRYLLKVAMASVYFKGSVLL